MKSAFACLFLFFANMHVHGMFAMLVLAVPVVMVRDLTV